MPAVMYSRRHSDASALLNSRAAYLMARSSPRKLRLLLLADSSTTSLVLTVLTGSGLGHMRGQQQRGRQQTTALGRQQQQTSGSPSRSALG
mmetsp:Transcript_5841/g.10358  ORF Transcript_5841/g.10358 Transcript_5841/m.10358 type:complete len:91 (-) Transcript_5841:687-959(-)